ncbi:RING-14 protein [Xylariaceae sp. FL1019]|nr:RING-14 protein [Xylariaceae sp. FL1019]
MKFAQEFRKALQREEFPQKWVDCAIPYGQLKKCLKKVTNELQELGLGKDTLAGLAESRRSDSDLRFRYYLDGKTGPSAHFRPRLTVFVQLKDGIAVDARLTPATREFLEKIAFEQTPDSTGNLPLVTAAPSLGDPGSSNELGDVRQVEVPLVFDAQFFEILQTDVSNIGTLQEEEQLKLQTQITQLGQDLGRTIDPSQGRKAKADLEVWRNIFELYLDARVFFSARERDSGARTSAQAVEQLHWFQDQVVQRRLVRKLKSSSSQAAFSSFVQLNVALLSILKFREINNLAVQKILKKFDKRTSLGVSKTFPAAVNSDRLLASSVARDVCAQMSRQLIATVPQLDDYLCPICLSVAYWPVKLQCQHTFCSRCLVKMSRKGERFCPLCRADTIMLAGLENFDADRAAFLRKYFPKEVKEKVRANERERNEEIFGPGHKNVECCVM